MASRLPGVKLEQIEGLTAHLPPASCFRLAPLLTDPPRHEPCAVVPSSSDDI